MWIFKNAAFIKDMSSGALDAKFEDQRIAGWKNKHEADVEDGRGRSMRREI